MATLQHNQQPIQLIYSKYSRIPIAEQIKEVLKEFYPLGKSRSELSKMLEQSVQHLNPVLLTLQQKNLIILDGERTKYLYNLYCEETQEQDGEFRY